MKQSLHIAIRIVVFCAFSSFGIAQSEFSFVPGDIILQMKPGFEPSYLVKELGLTTSRSSIKNIEQISQVPFNVFKIKTSLSDGTIDEYILNLKKDPAVLFAQKNKRLIYRKVPNDPLFKDQWQFKNPQNNGIDLGMDQAWDISTGGITALGDTIVVAVLEDGIGRHDDIVNNLWINCHEIPGDNIDNDGNGYVDDYLGWNVETKNDNVNFDDRHGTSVAGIIGAKGNNNLGVTGMNWDVKIMSVVTGDITEANVIAAYAYVFKQRKLYNETNGKKGAFIVATNSSWGIDRGKPSDSPIWCSFYDSLGSVGVLSCAATANEAINVDIEGDLPTACTSDFLIAVTNINKNDVKANLSGFGKKSIDIGAFGDGTYNISSSNRYATFTGTSAATPHVTGAIALAYSVACSKLIVESKKDPARAALFLKQAILASSKENASLNGNVRSQGRLDVGSLMKMVNEWCSTCPAPLIDDQIKVDAEGKFSLSNSIKSGNIKLDLRLRKEGILDWVLFENIGENFSVNDLQLCGEYEYQLRTTCDKVIITDFRYSRFFTSYGCCPAPKVKKTFYDENSISVVLEEQGLVDKSILELREKGTINWEEFTFDTLLVFNNVEDCKLYEFRISSSCLEGRSLSPLTNEQTINTECGSCTDLSYCNNLDINNAQEWISSVSLGTSTWESSQDKNGFGQFLGYKIPKLKPNEPYKIEVIPAFLSQTYQEFFKVYMDLNQDKIFDAKDLIYSSNSKLSFVRDTLLIPKDATPGLTRMRIVMSFEDKVVSCDNDDNYGEVEEYCVEILKSVPTQGTEITRNEISLLNTIFDNGIAIKTVFDESQSIQAILYSVDGKILNINTYEVPSQENIIHFSGPTYLVSGIYLIQIKGKFGQKSFKVLNP